MAPQWKSERDKIRRRHERRKRPGDKGESRKEWAVGKRYRRAEKGD